MRGLIVVVILGAAAVARADEPTVPGGRLYLGVGAHSVASAAGVGWALSLEGQLEGDMLFASGTLLLGGAGGDRGVAFFGLRGGAFITSSPMAAPYVAIGFGRFGQGAIGDDALGGPGIALEAGVALFRARRFGRITISGQVLAPMFSLPDRPEPWDRLDTWFIGSMRALL